MSQQPIRNFMERHFHHFNAAVTLDAAKSLESHLNQGDSLLISLAGAMSTAELGISLAELIRRDQVHAISCTGANLEEDIFNLVAHEYYSRIPNYRDLTPEQEVELRDRGMNRVTDTCIPEEEAMRRLEKVLIKIWQKLDNSKERLFPYEIFYRAIETKDLEEYYQIDPKDSWVLAAYEKGIPIYSPGWEDSTIGNFVVSQVLKKQISSTHFIRSGLEQMEHLVQWYLDQNQKQNKKIGFFQIGGGIAGDFAICSVPLILQDLKEKVDYWSYFCQISDSTTSFGSYSGAVPNEKITWNKIDLDTPQFIIESDATIVAPLIFQYILEGK